MNFLQELLTIDKYKTIKNLNILFYKGIMADRTGLEPYLISPHC